MLIPHLLVFGVETTVTTATCLATVMRWEESEGFGWDEKKNLAAMYGPYLFLGEFASFPLDRLSLRAIARI